MAAMGVRFFMRQTPGEWVRGTAGVMINAELGWTQEGSWIDALAYPNHIHTRRYVLYGEQDTAQGQQTIEEGLVWG